MNINKQGIKEAIERKEELVVRSNEEDWDEVQKWLFELGCEWVSCSSWQGYSGSRGKQFIISEDKILTCGVVCPPLHTVYDYVDGTTNDMYNNLDRVIDRSLESGNSGLSTKELISTVKFAAEANVQHKFWHDDKKKAINERFDAAMSVIC